MRCVDLGIEVCTHATRGNKKRWIRYALVQCPGYVRARTYGKPFHARLSTYRVTILPTSAPIPATMTTTVNAHYNGFMLLIRTHLGGIWIIEQICWINDLTVGGKGGEREREGGEEGRVIVWLPSYVTVYNKCLATFLSFWRIQMMRFDSVIGSLLVFKKVSWKGKWSD